MSIKAAACTCGAEFNVKDELAGKRAKCPKYGEASTITDPKAATKLIRVTCQCGKVVNAKRSLAGKQVKCPACGQALEIRNPNVEADSPEAGDQAPDVSSDIATTVGPAGPEPNKEPTSSNRRRYVLLGVGGAGVVVALLLVVVGLGLFRDRPPASEDAGSSTVSEKADVAAEVASPRVAAEDSKMTLAVEKAVGCQATRLIRSNTWLLTCDRD